MLWKNSSCRFFRALWGALGRMFQLWCTSSRLSLLTQSKKLEKLQSHESKTKKEITLVLGRYTFLCTSLFVEIECFVLILCYFLLIPFTYQIIFFLCNGPFCLVLLHNWKFVFRLLHLNWNKVLAHSNNALKNLLKQRLNLLGSLTWWFSGTLAEILLLPCVEQVKWNNNYRFERWKLLVCISRYIQMYKFLKSSVVFPGKYFHLEASWKLVSSSRLLEGFSAVHGSKAVAAYCLCFRKNFLYSRRINAVLYLAMHSALLVLKHRSERNLTKEIKILKTL